MFWITALLERTITPIIRKLYRSSLGIALIPIIILVTVGTVAYSYFEGWSLADSLYATIITITTVGYGDFSPQTVGGRIFAIFFTLSAIGLASYAISTLAAVVIDWEQERVRRHTQEQRMEKIASLKNHVIICGCSPVGRKTAYFFQQANQPFILVEADEDALRRALLYLNEEYIQKRFGHYRDITQAVDVTEDEQLSLEELTKKVDVPYLLADPTDDSTLMAAGIATAMGMAATLRNDERNLFAVVSARALATRLDNPKLRILSLVHDDKNGPKLQIAGADQLILPEKGSGLQLQQWMMNPLIGNFWKEVTFKAETPHSFQQFAVADHPQWAGKTVTQLRDQHRVVVLALWREGKFYYELSASESLNTADEVIAFAPK